MSQWIVCQKWPDSSHEEYVETYIIWILNKPKMQYLHSIRFTSHLCLCTSDHIHISTYQYVLERFRFARIKTQQAAYTATHIYM